MQFMHVSTNIFLSTNTYITLFYVCLYMLFIYYYWTYSLEHYNSYLNKAYLTHVFSIRHIISFLHIRTLDSNSVVSLEAILKSQITNKKHRNVKNMALNRSQKGDFFIVWKVKQKGRAWCYSICAGKVHIRQYIFHVSQHVCAQMTAKASLVLISELQIHFNA